MGDQEHGAVERPERLLELLDRGQVEVVRRFVEHEAVDAGDREQREDSARAFAGRECARRSQHVFRAESELRERRTARRRVRTATRAGTRPSAFPSPVKVSRACSSRPSTTDGPSRCVPASSGQLAQECVQQASSCRCRWRRGSRRARRSRSRGRSVRARTSPRRTTAASSRATTSPLRGAVATSMRSSHPTHGFSTAVRFEPLQRAVGRALPSPASCSLDCVRK